MDLRVCQADNMFYVASCVITETCRTNTSVTLIFLVGGGHATREEATYLERSKSVS